jgi:hypothetical protein
MAKFGFDVTEVELSAPRGEYEPLPAGDYVLKALEADEKKTSTGGTMIAAKFEVVRGEHAGRLIWQNFNTINKSKDAQRIGREQLVAWATACGKPNEDDTDKLLGKPFAAAVAIEPGTGGYKPSNKIKVFLFEQVADAPAPAKKAPPVAKAAPVATSKKPWDE